ncbi:MAG: hypothetical protein V1779_14840 [bacterium]
MYFLVLSSIIIDDKKASRMLRGIAKYNIPNGRTLKLPITNHIKTKPTNQDSMCLSF